METTINLIKVGMVVSTAALVTFLSTTEPYVLIAGTLTILSIKGIISSKNPLTL